MPRSQRRGQRGFSNLSKCWKEMRRYIHSTPLFRVEKVTVQLTIRRFMKATFALIANNEIHNLVRKLSWDIHQKYQTGIDVTRLPPHISLKQPFDILNLTFLEEYMMNLARSITPFEVRLTELQLINMTMEGLDTGILWL